MQRQTRGRIVIQPSASSLLTRRAHNALGTATQYTRGKDSPVRDGGGRLLQARTTAQRTRTDIISRSVVSSADDEAIALKGLGKSYSHV
jgi:hypothetical protein